MVAVEPAQGRRQQEPADLVAAVVEDRRAPVRVDAHPWVRVLVEVRAVEGLETELVGGEVRRHPIQDHADAVLVQVVDEEHEVLRRPIARGRGEVARDLVTPRLVERMLHHRQELDVREAHARDVVGEAGGELAVGEPAAALLRHAHPGPDVDLVDGRRRAPRVDRVPPPHPIAVSPVVAEVPHDGGPSRRRLRVRGERVRLVDSLARDLRMDEVLVERAMTDGRDESFPDAGLLALVEPVRALVPAIEVADDADAFGVRRPYSEVGALGLRHRVRAELVEEVAVRALVEQVDVEGAQQRACRDAHAGATRSSRPRSGIATQSGRRFNSYRSSYSAFSSSIVLNCSSRSSFVCGSHDVLPAVER